MPADSPLAFLVSPEGAQWFADNPGARVVPKEVVENWWATQQAVPGGAAPAVFADSEGNPLTADEVVERYGQLAPGQSVTDYAAQNGLTLTATGQPYADVTAPEEPICLAATQ